MAQHRRFFLHPNLFAASKKTDEINHFSTFLVDELEKHPEYAQIIHRELHNGRLAATHLPAHPTDEIKNLPFIFERLQQIYFWSKDPTLLLQIQLPNLATQSRMKLVMILFGTLDFCSNLNAKLM